jgi:hypothetical protein
LKIKALIILIFLFSTIAVKAQSVVVSGSVDTSGAEVRASINLLRHYISCFSEDQQPNYAAYWCEEDIKRTSLPDDMVFAISSDVSTYRFGDKMTVFFCKAQKGIVHLKALLSRTDQEGNLLVWAIMNYYVKVDKGRPLFMSEVVRHKSKYRTIKNGNINYHFPSSETFNKPASDSMLQQIRKLELDWAFSPATINYYYAPDDVALAAMRGLDYVYGLGRETPSGMGLHEHGIVYCQGLGEGYLHEVLHIYFNARYGQSPMCHALIYYLAGGLGQNFDWMIRRMNEYLIKYPETDLAKYDTLQTKDPMLHIDQVAKGVLCKMLDEKEGIVGLKKALQYRTVQELLKSEFGVTEQTTDAFLRTAFKKYDKSN